MNDIISTDIPLQNERRNAYNVIRKRAGVFYRYYNTYICEKNVISFIF